MIMVPTSWGASRRSSRSRWPSLSVVLAAMSKLSWTRESVVLTPCPPGPDARVNRSVSSPAGMVRPSGTPGPGGITMLVTASSLGLLTHVKEERADLS